MDEETSDKAGALASESYEAPAITVLGTLATLTSVEGGSVHDESDRLLKANVAAVERPLERLRTIRTR